MDWCIGYMKKWQDVAPLALRFALGVIFFMHGWQKLTVFSVGGTSAFLASLGFPIPGFFAVVLIAVETLGGIALVLGLFTHVAAKLAAIVAVVALFSVHIANGFFINPEVGGAGYGYEYILLILAAAVSLTITGAGKYSLDARLSGARDSM